MNVIHEQWIVYIVALVLLTHQDSEFMNIFIYCMLNFDLRF